MAAMRESRNHTVSGQLGHLTVQGTVLVKTVHDEIKDLQNAHQDQASCLPAFFACNSRTPIYEGQKISCKTRSEAGGEICLTC